jgi:hypothetical protein
MQTTHAQHLHDACQILAYSAVQDAYNIPQASYTAGAEMACGVEPVGTDEALDEAEVPLLDAKFRFPIGTVLNPLDRIRLTKRYGVAVDPADFDMVGFPLRGPSGLVVEAKRVTNE